MTKTIQRCSGCGSHPTYMHYHDTVSGRPVSDSRELFEKPCLDGQQAGFNFVGTTICYAFMQAIGMVNDHYL